MRNAGMEMFRRKYACRHCWSTCVVSLLVTNQQVTPKANRCVLLATGRSLRDSMNMSSYCMHGGNVSSQVRMLTLLANMRSPIVGHEPTGHTQCKQREQNHGGCVK